jgi:hypothetical protein
MMAIVKVREQLRGISMKRKKAADFRHVPELKMRPVEANNE